MTRKGARLGESGKPASPGWYWHRFDELDEWIPYRVYKKPGIGLAIDMRDGCHPMRAANRPGEWVPIPYPEEDTE